jgi:hypothetical protein
MYLLLSPLCLLSSLLTLLLMRLLLCLLLLLLSRLRGMCLCLSMSSTLQHSSLSQMLLAQYHHLLQSWLRLGPLNGLRLHPQPWCTQFGPLLPR